jgi:hypothetical protein
MSDMEKALTAMILMLFAFRILQKVLNALGVFHEKTKTDDDGIVEPSEETKTADGNDTTDLSADKIKEPRGNPLAKEGKLPGRKRLAVACSYIAAALLGKFSHQDA